MKTVLKTPSNVAIARMATLIVSKEVSRMIGPDGAMNLIYIGAIQKLIFPRYRRYYDAVDIGFIDLATVHQHFSPEAWKLMSAAKLKLLEAGIRKEVESVRQQIHGQMLVLHRNEVELATLTGQGQAAVELTMQELTGQLNAACAVTSRRLRVLRALASVKQVVGDETQEVLRDALDRQAAALDIIQAAASAWDSTMQQEVLSILQQCGLACKEGEQAV